MQNQEFSEEYYKMKYFKYRAKYEQLKEFAEQRSGIQTGGSWGSPFSKKTEQAAVSNQKQVLDQQKKELINKIKVFASQFKTDKEQTKIEAKLESPCSPNDLINIVNSAIYAESTKMLTADEHTRKQNAHKEEKEKLIAEINKICKTIDQACKLVINDEKK